MDDDSAKEGGADEPTESVSDVITGDDPVDKIWEITDCITEVVDAAGVETAVVKSNVVGTAGADADGVEDTTIEDAGAEEGRLVEIAGSKEVNPIEDADSDDLGAENVTEFEGSAIADDIGTDDTTGAEGFTTGILGGAIGTPGPEGEGATELSWGTPGMPGPLLPQDA